MFCSHCGAEIHDKASICVKCGCAVNQAAQPKAEDPAKSPYDWTTVMLLSLFLGGLGVHSFYVGKTGIGIAQLLTLGGCGIWALIDFIMVLTGSYTDAEGKRVYNG